MYASIVSTGKILYWLTLVLCVSGPTPFKNMSTDYEDLYVLRLTPIGKSCSEFDKFFVEEFITSYEPCSMKLKSNGLLPYYFRRCPSQGSLVNCVYPPDHMMKAIIGLDEISSNPEIHLIQRPVSYRFQQKRSRIANCRYTNEGLKSLHPLKHNTTNGNSFLFFLSVSSVTFLYIRKYTRNIYFRIYCRRTKKQKTSSADKRGKQRFLPPEVRMRIWRKLDKFEKDKSYLDKEVKIETLAARFKTNSRYLSLVINDCKKMTFPIYLQTLRITNAKKCILENSSLSAFNLEGLADEFGFNSARSFSLAFKKVTGGLPSKFLKELRAQAKMCDFPCDDDS